MNIHPESIVVNSCEYTPVYLIPNSGVNQTGSYYLAPNTKDVQLQKPVSDNLKRFYENSGNLEGNALGSSKRRILKKASSSVVGNNLKLASFLLPKSEPQVVQTSQTINVSVPSKLLPATNVVVKPSVTTVNFSKTVDTCSKEANMSCLSINTPTMPIIEVDRKIVRIPPKNKMNLPKVAPMSLPKVPPKILPKEPLPPAPSLPVIPVTAASNTTSVQLIKLGKTYHSLNQLSDEEMRVVNTALKLFNSGAGTIAGATAGPRSNGAVGVRSTVAGATPGARLVSTAAGVGATAGARSSAGAGVGATAGARSAAGAKAAGPGAVAAERSSKPEPDANINPKFIYKLVSTKDLTATGRNKQLTKKKPPPKKVDKKEPKEEPIEDEMIQTEPQVTRSGRTVKQSRRIRREEPQKPKKKIAATPVHCFQCLREFPSLYRLQRHYESLPTHIPQRVHCNLFHCLQAILKGTSKDNQAHMFVQQLEHLLQKLRSLLPCLLQKMAGCDGSPCTVSNDIGGLFSMLPGRYSLNMEALDCVKDTEGHCVHNPPPPKAAPTANITKNSRVRITNDEQNNADNEDCARINSVDKWPTISKRIQNKKRAAEEKFKSKRIRLISENGDGIELSIDDVVTLVEPEERHMTEQDEFKEQTISVDDSTIETPEIQMEASSDTLDDALRNIVEGPQKLVEEQSHVDQSETIDMVRSQDNIEDDLSDDEKITEADPKEPTSTDQSIKHLTQPIKFYSTHFDIRSSPIKLPSALVKKFQIKPEEASSDEVQILRPLIPENANEDDIRNQNDGKLGSENDVQENDSNLSNDVSFSLDQMFPDNEIPKEVLNELNDLSFQSNIFDSPLTKALKDINNFDQSLEKQSLFDPNLMDVNSDANIEPAVPLKDKVDGYFEPAAIHVKIEKPNGVKKSALTRVKERSKILFEASPTAEQTKTIDQLQFAQKQIGLFDKSSSNPYGQSTNLKENGINRSQSNTKINGLFQSGVKHSKGDTLISTTLIDDKSNDMMMPISSMISSEQTLPTSIIDSSLMDDKHIGDLNNSDYSSNDARLLSNPGQSVLTFLESLTSDCLAYPETEIRNTTEDFQLDLFSFSST